MAPLVCELYEVGASAVSGKSGHCGEWYGDYVRCGRARAGMHRDCVSCGRTLWSAWGLCVVWDDPLECLETLRAAGNFVLNCCRRIITCILCR